MLHRIISPGGALGSQWGLGCGSTGDGGVDGGRGGASSEQWETQGWQGPWRGVPAGGGIGKRAGGPTAGQATLKGLLLLLSRQRYGNAKYWIPDPNPTYPFPFGSLDRPTPRGQTHIEMAHVKGTHLTRLNSFLVGFTIKQKMQRKTPRKNKDS